MSQNPFNFGGKSNNTSFQSGKANGFPSFAPQTQPAGEQTGAKFQFTQQSQPNTFSQQVKPNISPAKA
jgi:hypothetical protein